MWSSCRAADWPPDSLPDYLRPRMEVMDRKQQVVASSRDLDTVRREGKVQAGDSAAWETAVQKWGQEVGTWSFGDLPESVLVETVGGMAVHGWPGLSLRANCLCQVSCGQCAGPWP